VLPIAAAGIAFASVLALCLEWDPTPNPYIFFGKALGQTIGGAIGGTVQAFAIITFVFAVLERKKVSLAGGDFFASLPVIPKAKERIRPHEPVVAMVWSVVAAVVFLGFPQIAGAWLDGAGWIPVLAVDVVRGLWLPILLWAVFGIAKEIVRLIEGRYTKLVAVVTIAADLLTAICAVLVFRGGKIMNPAFTGHIADLFLEADGGAHAVVWIFEYFHLLFLGLVLFALALDAVTAAVKAWRGGKADHPAAP